MIEDLRIFVYIVDNNGFANAAKLLKLQPTTLSKRMSELETMIEITLFTYEHNKLQLTEDGKQIYIKIKQNIYDVEAKLKEIHDQSAKIHNELTVVLPPYISSLIIAPNITKFIQAHPEIVLNFAHVSTDISFIDIQYDIAISLIMPKKESLLIKSIAKTFGIVCASAKYIDTYGLPQSLTEINQHKCGYLSFSYNKAATQIACHDIVNNKIFNYKLPIKPYIITDHHGELLELVKAGICVGGLTNMFVQNEINTQQIINIFPNYTFGAMNYYSIRPKVHKSYAVDLFENFIIDCFKELETQKA